MFYSPSIRWKAHHKLLFDPKNPTKISHQKCRVYCADKSALLQVVFTIFEDSALKPLLDVVNAEKEKEKAEES